MQIDIVSDVVCPWCVIGWKQLERALDETGTDAVIQWRPFELNPDMPLEGENLRAHVARKYGTTPEGSARAREKIAGLGAELGFSFAYSDGMRIVNTFAAHQLLHWAREQGSEHALKLALFSAFFSEGRDVSDPAVLAECAGSVGLDAAAAAETLAAGSMAAATRAEQRAWIEGGVTGVPAMVFDSKRAAIGAQGVDHYATILRGIAAK